MDDAEREVIAKRLSTIASEEDFNVFESEMSVLWKNKTEIEKNDKKKLEEAKASIDKQVPNSIGDEEELREKFKKLAGGVTIKIN